ncbi:unnamed protein product [Blepharisma stoltei]|uniref:Uncharacterized protein n=1 Tax=Blepharisma stoltei TaxID=1481888 RepID=A0AAU9J318_9CILI|nr:unnamed protein product [Blepharisma stoltei]
MVLIRAWIAYNKLLESQPFKTQLMTAVFMGWVGDGIAQVFVEKHPFSIRRSLVVNTYGVFETIIEGYYWLHLLDRIVGHQLTAPKALIKTGLDMFLFGPFEIAMFMTWTNVFERSDTSLEKKLQEDFMPVFIGGSLYWFPASFICFYLVSMKYRLIFSSIFCIISDTFMSYATHNSISFYKDLLVEKVYKFLRLKE